ncbi:hypothetical protein DFH09DRAFT_1110842 [Mycena vulgaris]|nr:hypothetical protein DFH09DRAFT_1110842 [Mycena vulgaris]
MVADQSMTECGLSGRRKSSEAADTVVQDPECQLTFIGLVVGSTKPGITGSICRVIIDHDTLKPTQTQLEPHLEQHRPTIHNPSLLADVFNSHSTQWGSRPSRSLLVAEKFAGHTASPSSLRNANSVSSFLSVLVLSTGFWLASNQSSRWVPSQDYNTVIGALCGASLWMKLVCIWVMRGADADAVNALKLSDDHPNDAEEGSPAGEKMERDRGSSGVNKQ